MHVCVCVHSVCMHSVTCFHSAFNIIERAASLAARPILWFKIDSVQTLSLANVAQLHGDVLHQTVLAIGPAYMKSMARGLYSARPLQNRGVNGFWTTFTTKCHKVIRDSAVICPAKSQKACVGTASSPVKRVKKSDAKVWAVSSGERGGWTHQRMVLVHIQYLSLSLAISESSTEAYSLSGLCNCQATSSFLVLGVLGGVVQKVL